MPGTDGADKILQLIIFFPLFMIAVSAHELAHAYIAMKQGDPTAKYAGRISLNPVNHLDPIGTFAFIITALSSPFVFGWARPVPINPVLFKNYRQGVIRVSLAGVGANFALMIATAIVFKILVMTGLIRITGVMDLSYYMATLLVQFMSLNMVLTIFNLIPIPPLDGSKVLMMMLPVEQANSFARIEPYGFFIIIGLLMFHVLDIVFIPGRLLLNFLITGFVGL